MMVKKRFFSIFISLLLLSIISLLPYSRVFSEETTPFIDYYLPYPGILPDHPFYKLKVLRDKITAVLITNPKKKIDFFLLQTDKGILAAAILVDKKKFDLAAHTAFKAEHNYTLLVSQLYRLPNKSNSDFFQAFEIAALKHQEVLLSLIKRVPKDKQKPFEQVLNFSKRNLKSLQEYQLQ